MNLLSLVDIYPLLPAHIQKIILLQVNPPPESPKDKAIKIKQLVSEVLEVNIEDNTRKRTFVWGRHIARYIIHKSLPMSLEAIGEVIGNADHSTVINSCRKAKGYLQFDKEFKEMYLKCKREVDKL